MRKNWLVSIIICTFIVGGIFVYYSGQSSAQTNADNLLKNPDQLMEQEHPGYTIKANSPDAKLLTQQQIESERNPRLGAKHVITELLPWGQALAKYDSAVKDYMIDPNRKIWVVQYSF